jgi:4-hydroxy-tetrahydrodipicolinate synthase
MEFQMNNIFNGCMPALMTPCNDDYTPNFELLVIKAKELIESGMSAVIYCGSMGDWPLLSDEDRQEGVARLVKAGIPTIVGTGAINTKKATGHASHAQEVGALGLMVIPRVLSRGPSLTAQRSHFASILKAAPNLPAVIYNSHYYGFSTRADLFFDLKKEFNNLVGFKEFGGAKDLTYAAEHITSQDKSISLMIGVDTTVFHGYVNCGAVGAITGVGNAFPKEVLHLIDLCKKAANGDSLARQKAKELDEALSVLSSFDEGPDLVLYYKYLMVLNGEGAYTLHFNPNDKLTDSQKGFAKSQYDLFKNWYKNWNN